MNSLTEENYIKIIYKLCEISEHPVSTNAISERMQIKAASVSDMLKKLSYKKLIYYRKYRGVTLTAKGQKTALEIIRKHRLWEMFLVQILNFKWDEVHDIAEQLEHIRSDELVKRIDKLLGFPKFDPHGDPIPDVHGNFHTPRPQVLSEITNEKNWVIAGVADHSSAFLRYLDRMNIKRGDVIKIDERVEYDRSFFILLKNKKRIHISNDVAKNILVLKK